MNAKERLLERLSPKVILGEVVDTLADRVIPQGAAELAQALNTGVAFVPYGPGQQPAEVESGLDPLAKGAVGDISPQAAATVEMPSAAGMPSNQLELSDPLQRAAANAQAAVQTKGRSRDLEIG